MLAVGLPQSIEKRLEKLARRTVRTKTYYVREAIMEHLDVLEDRHLAEVRWNASRAVVSGRFRLKRNQAPWPTPLNWRSQQSEN